MDGIAAVVLAGGKARRMGGGDKPLMTVGDRTMLAAVIAALNVPDTAISANGDPARFGAFGLRVLDDGAFQGRGPLAGVLAGLQWAASLGKAALLTAPGDTPFLPSGLATALSPAPCCVRGGDGRVHHLSALWPIACTEELRSFLLSGESSRVGDFTRRIGMRYVEFPVRGCDPFANINTIEELEFARKRALPGGGMKPGND
jgi:molybdopterin-guanine dinucleotide biosynthesis protein A